MVQRFAEIGGLSVLTSLLILVGLVAITVELCRVVADGYRLLRARRRRRAVARDLEDAHLSVTPSTLTVPDRRRPDVVRPEVPALRPGEPRDPGAAKVLAFRVQLEKRGYYVDELQIQRRLN